MQEYVKTIVWQKAMMTRNMNPGRVMRYVMV